MAPRPLRSGWSGADDETVALTVTRYAIVEHWTEDDSAETDDASAYLTWQLGRQPPAFG